MRNFIFCFHLLIVILIAVANGCTDTPEKNIPASPATKTPATKTSTTSPLSETLSSQQIDVVQKHETETLHVNDIVRQIETVSGEIGKDSNGRIISVDLAKGRLSVSDEMLRIVLQLPRLKKLRIAGNSITSETLRQIGMQTELEELCLQNTSICNTDLAEILAKVPQLRRLTLRSCNNISDDGIETVISLHQLRALSLINMNLTRVGLEKIIESKKVTALDLRQCSQLSAKDYLLLLQMPQLIDLKIAGFSIDDSVLETASQLPKLSGLTIEDAMISPEGFAKMTQNPMLAEKLTTLVLARNSTLFDADLVAIKNLYRLKRLTVKSMMITGEFLKELADDESKRPRLEMLSLEKSLLTLEGVVALKYFRELKSLNLAGVALSQELAENLAVLETPEIINLSECQLDNEMLKTIRNIKSVKTLILTGNPLIQE